jgi:hypothetical protein
MVKATDTRQPVRPENSRLCDWDLEAKVDKRARGSRRSRVVAQLGQQPAAWLSIAAFRELDIRGANLAIPRLPAEGE